MTTYEPILTSVKFAFALLAVLAILWAVVRPIWKMLTRKEDVEDLLRPYEPPLREEIQVPTLAEGPEKPSREAMMARLKADPHQTAMMLRNLMRDKGRSRPEKEK